MPHRTPGLLEQVATRVAFFVAGFAISSWAPLIPTVQARIGLNDGQLGSLLLCLGLGSIVAMPFSGALAGKFGCRNVLLVCSAIVCSTLPLMVAAPKGAVLATGLFLFGAGLGTMDVVMNIQASIVEKASGRAMMSGFHGLYSVGGIIGAGLITGLLSVGIAPLTAILLVIAISVVALLAVTRGFLPYGTHDDTPPFALPKGPILLLGLMCFILFLAEHSVLDWSGVLLTTERHLPKAQAGLGFLAFSITMTTGRLLGDQIVRRVGPYAILVFGGLTAALGYLLASLVPSWPVSVLGFALVGAGASNVVPVLFSAAGRQRLMPSNLAIAAITTLGYTGMFIGPAMIGYIAHASTLPIALLFVAAMLVGVAFSARRATSIG